jgi:hypothetical protein
MTELLRTAEDDFRQAVQMHLKRLEAAGVPHPAAIDLLLASIRGGQGQPISETEVAQLVNAHAFSHQDALRALIVREEVRCLKAQGMLGCDAVRVLITRLAAARPPAPVEVAAPVSLQQLPQQHAHFAAETSHQHATAAAAAVAAAAAATVRQQQHQPVAQQPSHSPKRPIMAHPAVAAVLEHRHSSGGQRRKRAEWEAVGRDAAAVRVSSSSSNSSAAHGDGMECDEQQHQQQQPAKRPRRVEEGLLGPQPQQHQHHHQQQQLAPAGTSNLM